MEKIIFGSLITTLLSWLYTTSLDKNSTIVEGLANGFIIITALILLITALFIVVIPVIRFLDKGAVYFYSRQKQRHELEDAVENELSKKKYEAHEACQDILLLAHQEKTELLASAQAKNKELELREHELAYKELQFENKKIENRKHLTSAENKIKNIKYSVNKIVQYICDDLNNLALKNKMPYKQINKRLFKIKKGIGPELKKCNLDLNLSKNNNNIFFIEVINTSEKRTNH